jgi:hypothetical protein
MICFAVYTSAGDIWRDGWSTSMPLNTMLATSFRFLSDSHDRVLSTEEFNRHRDLFRDALVQLHPSFPRYGQVGSSAGAILDLLTSEIERRPYVAMLCANGCNVWESTTVHCPDALPSTCVSRIWSSLTADISFVPVTGTETIQTWVSVFLQCVLHRNKEIWCAMTCPTCGAKSLSPTVCFHSPPPILFFEDDPSAQPHLRPCPVIAIPTAAKDATYDLRGIINLAGYHFTAQLFEAFPSKTAWFYDGRINGGTPIVQQQTGPEPDGPAIYLYARRP